MKGSGPSYRSRSPLTIWDYDGISRDHHPRRPKRRPGCARRRRPGQHGETVFKSHANKVRALKGGKVLAGFAGSVADALTLYEKFEEKLDRYPGNLPRAAVELAKDWRSDRMLRRLEALLVVADLEHSFLLSGTGELIEPDDGIVAIGSGGNFALAAARALLPEPDSLGPRDHPALAGDRGRHLRLHQSQHHDSRIAGNEKNVSGKR